MQVLEASTGAAFANAPRDRTGERNALRAFFDADTQPNERARENISMQSKPLTTNKPNLALDEAALLPNSELWLRDRIQLVEKLWESVLRSECGSELVERLVELIRLSRSETAPDLERGAQMLREIEKLDLHDAIRTARAFALYFQLINIVEQHYEQREQQQAYQNSSVLGATSGSGIFGTTSGSGIFGATADGNVFGAAPGGNGLGSASGGNGLEERAPIVQARSLHPSRESGTFQSLFPKLRKLNVPPRKIQQLLDQLDIRLVFTAHPTEIVRQTIRAKQRRIARVLRRLDEVERMPLADAKTLGVSHSWEAESLRERLKEEIGFWWRTDELHPFKPTVLGEVASTLRYFNEALFEVMPKLYERLDKSLRGTFSSLEPPSHNFCKFGSWVGADRDGNPSVTPDITWSTACYQRNLVLEHYIKAIDRSIEQLSLSLHWSDVLPELLDALERDRQALPEIYDELAIRYASEPYRLKLAYVKKRLQNTRDRNWRFYQGGENFDRDQHQPRTRRHPLSLR